MQELVDVIRRAGSTQVILLGGVACSNSLSQWLAYEPRDPLGRIGAAWHVYNFNACSFFVSKPRQQRLAIGIATRKMREG